MEITDVHETEFNKYKRVLNRFIRPSFQSINKKGREELRKDYLKDSGDIHASIIRKYLFENPTDLNELILLLDLPNRFKLGKILCGLINADIKASSINFGKSYSGRIIETLFQYRSTKKESRDKIEYLEYLYIASIILEIPIEMALGISENNISLSYSSAYEMFDSKKVSTTQDFLIRVEEGSRKAKMLFEQYGDSNIVADVIIYSPGSTNKTINVKVHFHRKGHYELFFYFNQKLDEFSGFLSKLTKLNALYYYYGNLMLRNDWNKICVLCSSNPLSNDFNKYKSQLESLVQLNKISPSTGF